MNIRGLKSQVSECSVRIDGEGLFSLGAHSAVQRGPELLNL